MNNKQAISVVIIVVLLAIISVIVFSKSLSNFEDYENAGETTWKPSGLDLEAASKINADVLSSYNIEISSMSESEFYYDGVNWSATVLSNDGVPYTILIDSDFVATVILVETDAEEVIE